MTAKTSSARVIGAQPRYPNLFVHIVGLTLVFCGAGLLLSGVVELIEGGTDDWSVGSAWPCATTPRSRSASPSSTSSPR